MIRLTDDHGRALTGAPDLAPYAGFVGEAYWGDDDACGPETVLFVSREEAEQHWGNGSSSRWLPDGLFALDTTLPGYAPSYAVLTPVVAGDRLPRGRTPAQEEELRFQPCLDQAEPWWVAQDELCRV